MIIKTLRRNCSSIY